MIQRNSTEAINLFIEITGWTPVTCPSSRGIHGFLILEKGWLTAQATNELWHGIVRQVQAEAKKRGLLAKLECKGKAKIITDDFSYGGVPLKDPFTGMNPTDDDLTKFWKTLDERTIVDSELRDKRVSLLDCETALLPACRVDSPIAQAQPISAINEKFEPGTWVKNCRKWAIQGLSEHDSMPDVVFELSKWLYFIEFFDLNEDDRYTKVVNVLQQFCQHKHNGYITRLNLNKSTEVMTHVERIVHSMIQGITASAKACFQRIRRNRANGQYRDEWFLESSLLSEVCGVVPVKLIICCSVCPNEEEKTSRNIPEPSEWVYVPDMTPLPDSLEKEIREALKARGAKVKTYDKLVGFLNHLKSKNGEARLGVQSLKKMGFSDHRARLHIKMLHPMGLILEKDGSRVAHIGKLFVLTTKAREAFGMPVFDPDE